MRQKARGRWRTLVDLQKLLDPAMIVLALAWLVLLAIELIRGLSPTLELVGTVIWVIFIAEFVLSLAIAPDRKVFLKHNVLTAISLLVPALRAFRVLRALRGLRVIKLVTSVNRGMHALGRALRERGFAYVLAATLLVVFAGALGMYVFEQAAPNGGFADYGEALWWTAMMITTLGSNYWPQTTEGRVLCFLIALYAFSMFGYVTATIATYFLGDRARRNDTQLLRQEISSLREEISRLRG